MLRITFDILPPGDESRARRVGRMELARIRTHDDGTADYAVVMAKTPPFAGALKAAWRKGRLRSGGGRVAAALDGEDEEMIVALATGHHRTRRGVYDLLYRALVACGIAARNPGANND